MDYSLALKLKNAGFPQISENVLRNISLEEEMNRQLIGQESNYISKPTLSELIKACPDHCGLQREDYGWAMYVKGFLREDTISDTPEEAVAKLWLALNKK